MIEILRLQHGLGVLQKTANAQMLNAVLKTRLLLNIFSKDFNEKFILIPFIYFVGPANSCKTIMMSFSKYAKYKRFKGRHIFSNYMVCNLHCRLNVIYCDDLRVNDFMIYNNNSEISSVSKITNTPLHERAY